MGVCLRVPPAKQREILFVPVIQEEWRARAKQNVERFFHRSSAYLATDHRRRRRLPLLRRRLPLLRRLRRRHPTTSILHKNGWVQVIKLKIRGYLK